MRIFGAIPFIKLQKQYLNNGIMGGFMQLGLSQRPRWRSCGSLDRWVRVIGWWLMAWTVMRTAGHSSTTVRQ